MAQYKFERHLKFCNDGVYDVVSPAGSPAPRSGIYRCDGCGLELTALAGQALPDVKHHEHHASQKLVRWKLIVTDGGVPAAPAPSLTPNSNARGRR